METSKINYVLAGMAALSTLLALGIVASAFTESPAVKPSRADTTRSGWSVYTSGTYGFTFEYPPDYRVEERVGGFFVISAPDEHIPQSGISIDARSQDPFGTFTGALEQVRRSLAVSEDTNIGDWRVFTGVGKEGMTLGIEFRQAVMRYTMGAIVVETINKEPYKSIFNEVVTSFRLTK